VFGYGKDKGEEGGIKWIDSYTNIETEFRVIGALKTTK